MKRIFLSLVLAAFFIVACTRITDGAIHVQWVELDDVKTECQDPTFSEAGVACFKWRGDTLFIYTRKDKGPEDRGIEQLLGRELKHGFKKDFHAPGSY